MKGVRSSGRLSLACVGALLAFAACDEEKQDAMENYNAPTPVVVTVRIKDPSDVARDELTDKLITSSFFKVSVREIEKRVELKIKVESGAGAEKSIKQRRICYIYSAHREGGFSREKATCFCLPYIPLWCR